MEFDGVAEARASGAGRPSPPTSSPRRASTSRSRRHGPEAADVLRWLSQHSAQLLSLLLAATVSLVLAASALSPHYYDGMPLPTLSLAGRERPAWFALALGGTFCGLIVALVGRQQAVWLRKVCAAVEPRRRDGAAARVGWLYVGGGACLALVGWTNHPAVHRRRAAAWNAAATYACFLALLAASSRNTALTGKLERVLRSSPGEFSRTLQRSRRWKGRANSLLWLAVLAHFGQALAFAALCSLAGGRSVSHAFTLRECVDGLGLTEEYCREWLEVPLRLVGNESLTVLKDQSASSCMGVGKIETLFRSVTEIIVLAALVCAFAVIGIDFSQAATDAPKPNAASALMSALSRDVLEKFIVAQIEGGSIQEEQLRAYVAEHNAATRPRRGKQATNAVCPTDSQTPRAAALSCRWTFSSTRSEAFGRSHMYSLDSALDGAAENDREPAPRRRRSSMLNALRARFSVGEMMERTAMGENGSSEHVPQQCARSRQSSVLQAMRARFSGRGSIIELAEATSDKITIIDPVRTRSEADPGSEAPSNHTPTGTPRHNRRESTELEEISLD